MEMWASGGGSHPYWGCGRGSPPFVPISRSHAALRAQVCRGGELLERLNTKHYSERTVASYMRAVLRTLAQVWGARCAY